MLSVMLIQSEQKPFVMDTQTEKQHPDKAWGSRFKLTQQTQSARPETIGYRETEDLGKNWAHF